jgi:tRNA1Val (adenine37-N6)-methyltransferase
MTRITHDSIAMRGAGIVHIAQPAKGHRFTLDSILLADFCRVKPKERALEPGAGTGVISLLLAKKYPRSRFYPVEVQDELHTLSEENRKTNGLENVISLHRDIRRLYQSIEPGHFDVVVTNPPYVRTGTGRTSPDPGRRAARQDLLARIEFWLDLLKFLKQGGRYNIVFSAARSVELTSLLRARKLEPKRLRFVHPYEDKPASLALIEAVRDGGSGLTVLPPLVVHAPGGGYTAEMKDIYGPSTEK